ncbi:MAG: DUF1501 domain-containing protein, partial [Myxococcota bacterium]
RARAATPPVKLVVVLANGGWDPTFTIDPKPALVDGGPYPDLNPDDPLDVEEIIRYGEIDVSTNARRRPSVTRYFDTWGDRTAVVNGLWVGSLSHWQAMVQVLTGTPSEQSPDVAAIAGFELAGDERLAAIDLGGVARFGRLAPYCARTGVRGQLNQLLAPHGVVSPDPWSPTDADRDAIRGYLDARAPAAGLDPRVFEALAERSRALDRAALLRSRGASLADQLPDGERLAFADDVPFIVSLLANDLCQAVVTSTEFTWDTHADASRQHGYWNGAFGGLAQLCAGLEAAGQLDSTLIVVLSEIGRSPRRNPAGGTDHWTFTSAVVVGAGVAGGRRVGGTDGELLTAAPVAYDAFAAGILDAVGVDAGAWLPGVTPFRGFSG